MDMFWVYVILVIAIIIVAHLIWKNRNLEDESAELDYDPAEYHRARAAYLQAQRNFELAEPQYIDVAISDLGISENRVDNEIRKLRLEGGDRDVDTRAALGETQ